MIPTIFKTFSIENKKNQPCSKNEKKFEIIIKLNEINENTKCRWRASALALKFKHFSQTNKCWLEAISDGIEELYQVFISYKPIVSFRRGRSSFTSTSSADFWIICISGKFFFSLFLLIYSAILLNFSYHRI